MICYLLNDVILLVMKPLENTIIGSDLSLERNQTSSKRSFVIDFKVFRYAFQKHFWFSNWARYVSLLLLFAFRWEFLKWLFVGCHQNRVRQVCSLFKWHYGLILTHLSLRLILQPQFLAKNESYFPH